MTQPVVTIRDVARSLNTDAGSVAAVVYGKRKNQLGSEFAKVRRSMQTNKYARIVALIAQLTRADECDAVVRAAYDQKAQLADALGTTDDRKKAQAVNEKWRQYRQTLVKGPTGKTSCPFCSRCVTMKKFHKYVYFSKPTPALHNGQEIVVRPCCLQCEAELRQRYEKECLCLQQQHAELVQLKRVAKVMSRGVSDLLKKESRRVKSLPDS